jgi:ubiquinone biosynthesis monooxygenase Coq7
VDASSNSLFYQWLGVAGKKFERRFHRMSSHEIRHFSLADSLIGHVDKALNNIFCKQSTQRPYPAEESTDDTALSVTDKQKAAALMRVNHAGEMAAQALYHGQSLTARDPSLRDKLYHASVEESDHLNWCRRRLDELDERPSIFDPLWYAGSFAIGITAGIAGDRWNLGFLEETEKQVVRHLESHLERLPQSDARSRAIVEQMKIDEQGHADLAHDLGAAELPKPVREMMKLTSKVLTNLAERI